MSVFFDNNITDVGRQLWAEMQAGGSFMPTRIVIGSGYMPAGKTSRTMTAVAEPVQDIELNKAQAQPDGDYIFGGVFTNRDVAQAFYYRELALYAKVKRSNGTETAEILYSYGNAGDNAELIPAYSTGTVIEKQLDLLVYIGNDANVTIEITTGVYVDRTEFNEAIAGITPAGIGALPADLPVISDMSVRDIVKSGRYYCFNCTDVPEGESNYGYLDVFVHHDDSDYRYLRYKSSINMNSLSFECLCDNGTWTDWVQAYSIYNQPKDIDGPLAVHDNVTVDNILYARTFQQLIEHYGTPIEIGQYIDMHLPGGNTDTDGRISIGEDKTLYYNYKTVWLSHAITSGSVNDLEDGVWEVGENVTDKATVQACVIYHKRWNDNFKTQLSMSYNGTQHFRTMVQGTWGAWQQIFTSGNAGVVTATVE